MAQEDRKRGKESTKSVYPHRSQSSARSPVRSLQPFLGIWDLNSLQSGLQQRLEDDAAEEDDEAEAIETDNHTTTTTTPKSKTTEPLRNPQRDDGASVKRERSKGWWWCGLICNHMVWGDGEREREGGFRERKYVEWCGGWSQQ